MKHYYKNIKNIIKICFNNLLMYNKPFQNLVDQNKNHVFSWIHYLDSAPLRWLDFGLQCVDLGRKIRAEKL